MKTKYLAIYIVLASLIFSSVILTDKIFAQKAEGIQYPVAELGGCENEAGCKSYCDNPDNTEACLDFAQKNNLMSDEEIAQAKKFLATGEKGPGGCKGKDECEQYCNDMSHMDECISYAEKNGLMSASELEEAKKVQAAINKGVKPPSCGNKEECDVYCEEADHMEECINFGIEAGFVQGQELENAQKMLTALKKGIKPPPCKGKDGCDEYCSNPDNMEVCMNFAMEAGFMSEEEKSNAQGMLQALKKGVKPPPCKDKDECDTYCQQEGHMEECINFSVAAGMMSEKDAEMARKTGGKGPGGCKDQEECDAFCNNPDNQETCFNFARDNGMIPEEDLKRMEEGKQQMKQGLEQASTEVIECLNAEIGADMVEKMKSGFMPPQNIGEKMQACFQKMGPPPGEGGEAGAGGMTPPAGQAGPGGCKTPEECNTYCESHQEECKNFYPAGDESLRSPEGPQVQQQGQMPPGQPCEGENCQPGPLPGQQMQPGQELLPGQNIQPPLSTAPGAGGEMAPGDQVPLVEPAEQAPPAENPQPPPSELPPEPTPESPPTSFIINTDSLVGSLIYAAFKALIH